MAGKEVSIWVKVRDGFTASLKRASSALVGFGSGIASAFKSAGIAAVGLGGAIAGAATFFLKANAAQESALIRLRAALGATGQESDALVERYKELANRIQDKTAQGDEETLKLIGLATQYGVTSSQMEKAIDIQLALAASGVENEAAIKMASSAVNGNYSALTRYIPALKSANTETEKQAALAEFTKTGLSVQAQMLSSTAGRWSELTGRLGDAAEEIGNIISGGTGVSGVMAMISEKIKSVTAAIVEWGSGGGWDKSITGVKTVWAATKNAFSNIADYVRGSWSIAAGYSQDFVNGLASGMVNLWHRIEATWRNGTENIKALFAAVWHKVTHPTSDFVAPDMKPLLDGFTAIEIASDKAGEARAEMAKNIAANDQKAADEIAAIWDEAAQKDAERMAKKEAEEKRVAESSVKLAQKESAEKLKAFVGLEKLKATFARASMQVQEQMARDAVAKAKAAADAALFKNRPETFAERLKGFVERRKDATDAEKEQARMDKKEASLLKKQASGIKISKEGRGFLADIEALRAGEKKAAEQAALAAKAEKHLAALVKLNQDNLKASGGPN